MVTNPIFAIRKRAAGVIRLERYVADAILTQQHVDYLRRAVKDRSNIVIAGGTIDWLTRRQNNPPPKKPAKNDITKNFDPDVIQMGTGSCFGRGSILTPSRCRCSL